MPASVLAERVEWTGSASWFRKRVAVLRPEYLPKDPADRLQYRPGDQAQCDLWFPPTSIPLGAGQVGTPPVLVIVASYSRFLTARMLPSRTSEDLVAGMWSLLADQLKAVPRRLVWDNEACIGRRNRLAQGVPEFTGALGTRVLQLKPFDPESKGIVERMNQYLETSFLPGRRFTSPLDFNAQLAQWLPVANQRRVRAIAARPTERIRVDRAAMLPLPPNAPAIGRRSRIRLGRDYYIRQAGNDYSVDPAAIGAMVEVLTDLDTVTVTSEGQILAAHQRAWAKNMTITDPAHVVTAATLRAAFQQPRPVPDDEELLRDLSVYDRAFGVEIIESTTIDGEVA
ncbi:transposase [Kocuria sp. CNJ-770]|nr:transposase [Kocuria sp. CNJ-770]